MYSAWVDRGRMAGGCTGPTGGCPGSLPDSSRSMPREGRNTWLDQWVGKQGEHNVSSRQWWMGNIPSATAAEAIGVVTRLLPSLWTLHHRGVLLIAIVLKNNNWKWGRQARKQCAHKKGLNRVQSHLIHSSHGMGLRVLLLICFWKSGA